MLRLIVIIAAFALSVQAQTPAQAFANPDSTFFNANGIPLALGTVSTYVAGTSTPIATCIDSQCSAMNTNPIVLNSAGRASIFLAAGQGYKLVVADSNSVIQYTVDNITQANTNNTLPLSGGTITGNLTVNGLTTLGNTIFTGSCTGTPCLWTSVGNTVSLVNSAQSVSPLLFENQAISGDTTVNLQASSSQSGALLNILNHAGVSQGGIGADFGFYNIQFTGTGAQFTLNATNGGTLALSSTGRILWTSGTNITGTPQFGLAENVTYAAIEVNNGIQTGAGGSLSNLVGANATMLGVFQAQVCGTCIAFQTVSSGLNPFQVNGQGDISGNGRITAIGATTGAAFAIGPTTAPTTVVDSSGNGFFNNLTVAGTCTGCGGGGGGGGLPVADTTIITRNATDPTKQMKFSNAAIMTGTTATLAVPQISFGTIMTEENTETISGSKTFTGQVFGTAGFTGSAFSSTNTSSTNSFQNSNFSFNVDGMGDISVTGEILAAKYIATSQFLATQQTSGTPASTPIAGYSGLVYRGGASGLQIWVYDVVHSTWSSIDLGTVAAPGLTSINGQTGPSITIAGTTNQITPTTTSNTVTLSLPQPIALTSNVAFNSINVGCGGPGGGQYATNSCAPAGTTIAFQVTNGLGTPFQVDGSGDISANGKISATGLTNGDAFEVNGIKAIDSSRNAFFNNVTVAGTCTGCGSGGGGITSINTQTGPAITITGGATAAALTVVNGGNTVTLTTPQAISTTSSPTFVNVSATGTFASSATTAFSTSTASFSVNSNGQVNGVTFFANTASSTAGFGVTQNTVVNSIQTVGGISTCSANTCQSGQAITIAGTMRADNNGYWHGPINTGTSAASIITIGSGGQFYGNAISGASTGISCSGVANGYEGYTTTDQYIVVCLGGVRYRAALTAF
jgi:hypothetical protein